MPHWKRNETSLYICADDFGISPAVSQRILDLAEQQVLTHTSCMTMYPEWPHLAEKLRNFSTPLSLGLHVDLPLIPKPADELTALRQLELFRAGMSRDPDFIDSHRNHHLVPGRTAIFKKLLAEAPYAQLRSYQQIGPFDKSLFARCKRTAFKYAWQRSSLKTIAKNRLFNDSLYSQENLRSSLSFTDWLKNVGEYLLTLPGGRHLMVVHPGEVDPQLVSRDTLTSFRATEARYLEHPEFKLFLKTHFSFSNF